MNEEETHECTACNCEFSEDEGGIRGYFGMLYMAFCPTCYACIWDMVDQQREWIGLTDKELEELLGAELGAYDLCLEVEAKLKELNTYD
jgi:hypothetical protein